MENSMILEARARLNEVNVKIAEATDVINLLKDAGIDVTEKQAHLSSLRKQAAKWDAALKNRGA